jgi:hypothetical protein
MSYDRSKRAIRWSRLSVVGAIIVASVAAAGSSFSEDFFPPNIIPRSEWKAKPVNREGMRLQKPLGIIVHHTSSRQRANLPIEKKMLNLQAFSQAPGRVEGQAKPAWGDVPYHYYIDFSGAIAEGRDVYLAGDTNTGYDTSNLIQIALEGDFEREKPTEPQIMSLISLMTWLSHKFNIASDRIKGHNQIAATDCPGRNMKATLSDVISGIR